MSFRSFCCEVCDRNPTCGNDCGSCVSEPMTAEEFERWMTTGDPDHETECTCDACLYYEGQQIGERYGFALAMALVQMAEWARECERRRPREAEDAAYERAMERLFGLVRDEDRAEDA